MEPELAPAEIATQLLSGLVAAWAAHDMAAFAELFHDDAAFVNVIGTYAHGRAEIQELHAAIHAGIYRNSAITMQLEDARAAADGVIVAHVASELSGDERAPDQVRGSILTLVIERRGADWKISAAQNTNIVPSGSYLSSAPR